MANYYTQFSTTVPVDNVEMADWLVTRLSPWDEGNNPNCPENWREHETVPCEAAYQTYENEVWLHADEYVDLEWLAEALADFTKHFDRPNPLLIEWATTCDKPRPDGFSGGAMMVYKGEVEWRDSSAWIRSTLDKWGLK